MTGGWTTGRSGGRAPFRGQPVLVMAAVLLVWLALRLALWEAPPGAESTFIAAAEHGASSVPRLTAGLLPDLEAADSIAPDDPIPARTAAAPGALLLPPLPERVSQGHADPLAGAVSQDGPAGANLVFAAAFSQMRISDALLAELRPAARPQMLAAPFPVRRAMKARSAVLPEAAPRPRWSGDAWLLLRRDTTTAITSGRPSYGRSQAGGVLRYNLAPFSRHRPALYARASAALEGADETEVAAGLAGRPFPRIPVSVAAELRVFDANGRSELRPAAFAVSELPPIALPLGLRGEAYVQGGYVGGDFATAFLDGQARVDRALVTFGGTELRVGASGWGGAQKDANRLDLGPGASLSFDLGGARARLAADWRFRVAGNAEPSSGPALTLAAGF